MYTRCGIERARGRVRAVYKKIVQRRLIGFREYGAQQAPTLQTAYYEHV